MAAVVSAGCSPAGISHSRKAALLEEVQTRGLIVGFEGLQPFSGSRIQALIAAVAQEENLAYCATSGNYMAHLPIIEEAHKHNQPIYLVGYSMGAEQARRLAQKCQQHDIPVRVLFLLDPRYLAAHRPGKVPANVRCAAFYTSGTYDDVVGVAPAEEHLAEPEHTALLVEDMPHIGHMGLPRYVTGHILTEVASDLGHTGGGHSPPASALGKD